MTSAPPSPGDAVPPPAAPLVLVVDDDERNRKLAQDVLRRSGLRTLEAATGRAAIALARDRLPDVVLLDLRLPDMEGTDVARALREGGRTAEIPVVALTALRYPDLGARLLADGFSGYLEKPIDVRTFPELVRGYCGDSET
jgi:two-component system, cell cycle response regulator DivK